MRRGPAVDELALVGRVLVRGRLLGRGERARPAACAGAGTRASRSRAASGPARRSRRRRPRRRSSRTARRASPRAGSCGGRSRAPAACCCGMKWCANENGRPSSPASRALKSLEPSSQIAGWLPGAGDGGDARVACRRRTRAARRAASAGRRPTRRALRRSAYGGDLVGAGRAADPEVDAARVQRLEHPELLGDHERLVVRQHHAARADAERGGRARQVGDQHRRRRAGDAGHVVVLGNPVAQVAEPLDVAGEVDRVAQRLADGRSGRDRREIENRDAGGAGTDHAASIATANAAAADPRSP